MRLFSTWFRFIAMVGVASVSLVRQRRHAAGTSRRTPRPVTRAEVWPTRGLVAPPEGRP